MDNRTLQLFLHLCDTLHFGRTSQAMHLSPSALTRNIQQLEESLGTTLFERDNRSVKLTKEGRLFQQYAKESLGLWQGFQQSLMVETQELQGELSIYCSVTASYSFLHAILSDFRKAHPKIAITLRTGDSEDAIKNILDDEDDLAIGARPDKLPSKVDFKRIATSPLVMIAPLNENRSHVWEVAPLILSEKGLVRKRVDAWFQEKNIKPNIYAQVSGNEAIVSLVSLGFGIGVVPKLVLDNSPLFKQVKEISHKPQLAPIDVGLCAQKKRLQNPVVRALWDSLLT
jgi:LysR family transcriptional regulator, positive regulator for ilvC